MKYYISDLHLGHKNILSFDNRPYFSVEGMNEDLIKRWNSVVTDNDDVFSLGDMFWKNELIDEILPKLKGIIHLITGNHDRINASLKKRCVSIKDCDEIKDGDNHVILSPKYRHNILIGNVSNRLKEICNEVSIAHDFIIEEIETDKNHVHMIINCNPRYGIMKCVQLIKSTTAIRLFEEFPYIKKKYLWGGKFWSRSSFVASVGSVSLKTVKKYIENQGK